MTAWTFNLVPHLQFKEGEKAETSIVSLSRTTALPFFLSSLRRAPSSRCQGRGLRSWIQITWWGGFVLPWEPGGSFTVCVEAVMSPVQSSHSSQGFQLSTVSHRSLLGGDVTMSIVTQGTRTQTLLICSSNALGGNRKSGRSQTTIVHWLAQTLTSFRKAQLKWPSYQRGRRPQAASRNESVHMGSIRGKSESTGHRILKLKLEGESFVQLLARPNAQSVLLNNGMKK